jgi:hypothetical protein
MSKRKNVTQFARYDSYTYRLNPESGYYQKMSGDNRLPDQLRTESVRKEEKYKYFNVTEFLTSRRVNGVTAFKTGLQRCSKTRNFFSGDMADGNGVKSLVAIAFSLDKTVLRVFVFCRFWKPHTGARLRYVEDFLTDYFNTKSKVPVVLKTPGL